MKRGVVVRTVALGLLLASTADAEAQRIERRGPGGMFGVSFVTADAVGEFGTFVDQGFGLELAGGLPVAAGGHFRLRGDFGFAIYGLERQQYCFSYSCRVVSDLTTTNSILYGGFGPELVLATGAVEPYVHASVGVTGLITSSSLDDHDGHGPYMETTNYSDAVFGWKAGGGLRFRLGNGRKPVFLDLGVVHHDNGVADFLTRGDIVDNPDGSITVFPNRSEADLFTYRLGVTIGFPGGMDERHRKRRR